jgi:hypothetical protein
MPVLVRPHAEASRGYPATTTRMELKELGGVGEPGAGAPDGDAEAGERLLGDRGMDRGLFVRNSPGGVGRWVGG